MNGLSSEEIVCNSSNEEKCILSSAYIRFDDFTFEQSDEEERDETKHTIEALLLVQRNL